METEPIFDVFAVAVPLGLHPKDDRFMEELNSTAQDYIWRQWDPGPYPAQILMEETRWLVTSDPEEADQFQPAHTCAECLAGAAKVRTFLRANPGRFVVLANLTYKVDWG